MDERFRGKKHWIGLGVMVIIFLCVMLCALGAMGMLVTRSGSVYGVAPQVQPAEGAEGGLAPVPYYGHGPLGRGQHVGSRPLGILAFGIGMIFKLMFFGLLLVLLIGLAKRFFWGHRYWHPPYGAKPPESQEGDGKPHAAWGPWAWRHHRKHWGPPPWWGPEPEPAGEKDEPEATDSEYNGPQE